MSANLNPMLLRSPAFAASTMAVASHSTRCWMASSTSGSGFGGWRAETAGPEAAGFGGSQGSGLSVEVGSLVLPVPLAWAWGPLKDRQSPLQVGDQVVGVLQAD